MITTSETTKSIDAALFNFQGSVESVKRDAKNPHFKSNYASLENVIDTARPALQQFGISFMQSPGAVVDGCLEVTTRLAHAESGEWISSTMQMPLGKRDPQGAGSAQTYAMRYSLMAMLGLPPTDDDAESAIDREDRRPAPTGDRTVTPAKSSASLKRADEWNTFQNELLDCHSPVALRTLYRDKQDAGWPKSWLEQAGEACAKRKAELEADDFPGDRPMHDPRIPANGTILSGG